jgi:nucleotide-binding universal stress UspA family protein
LGRWFELVTHHAFFLRGMHEPPHDRSRSLPSIRTIIVPTAFSDLSRHAARYAKALAEATGATIVVVHAVAPPPGPLDPMLPGSPIVAGPDQRELLRSGEECVARFIDENLAGASARSHVGIGQPDHEIVDFAKREHADLIVMGTHARGVMKRLVFGSVSKSVLESAPCPVLLVPVREAV